MEIAETSVSVITLILLILSGLSAYLKGRSDESLETIKEDFKKLSEYGKIDSEKVNKDEVYKEKKW